MPVSSRVGSVCAPSVQVVLETTLTTDAGAIRITDAFAMRHGGADKPRCELFDLPGLEAVADAEGSKAVSRRHGSAVIIAGAGMASGGRVVHHLKRFLPDPANSVALVGFQAAGTRGRRLLEGVTSLKIHGEYVRVRAEICDLTGFSVHADAGELLDWVGTCTGDPTVFVVHGEPDAAAALRTNIEARFDLTAVVPAYGERLLLPPR